MSDNYEYTIVNDEDSKEKEDVVMVINDFYNSSDFCDYSAAPVVAPTDGPVYEIVKEVKEDDKDKYHDISYAL